MALEISRVILAAPTAEGEISDTTDRAAAGWNPHGSGSGIAGDNSDDDESSGEDNGEDTVRAKRAKLFLLVKTAWSRQGWAEDLALQTFHTQDLWKDQTAVDKALSEQEVTTFPRVWPNGRKPTFTRADAGLLRQQFMQQQQQFHSPHFQLQFQQEQLPMATLHTPVAATAPAQAAANSPTTRMATLDGFLAKKMITEEEYTAKRAQIIKDI